MIALLVPVLAFSYAAVAQESACIGDWSVAAPIVRKEGLVNVEDLAAMVKAKLQAQIVNSALCGETGSYSYRLIVRPVSGPLKTITINARRPFD